MRAAGKGIAAATAGLLVVSFSTAAADAYDVLRRVPAFPITGITLVPTMPSSTQSRMALVFGDSIAPSDCASPLLLSLLRPSGQTSAAGQGWKETMAEPPVLAETQTWLTPDGRVSLHYTVTRGTPDAIPSFDRNRNGLPDYLEAVAAGLAESFQAAEQAGYLVRPSPSHRLDVYLANLGGYARGYMVPAFRPSRGAALLVIESHLYGDDALLRAVAAHQAAHAVLADYDLDEPAWWQEASAASIEVLSQRSVLRHSEGLERLLASPERGLLQADSLPGPAGLLWASYLQESSGGRPEVLRQIWEEEAAVEGDNLLEATERVLFLQGRALAGAFADFTTWNLFTGQRDDQQHYSFGSILPEPRFAASHSTFPAAAIPFAQAVAPLGWTVIRLEPDGGGGGMSLTFEGDPAGTWQADLLLASHRNPQTFRRVSLLLDTAGRATLGVPWGDSGEALLLVRNMRTSGAPATFSYSIQPAPAYPYELGSLSAETEAGHVRLVWETESEEDLAGWDVYRSEGRGGFQRISEVSIPAVGGSDGMVAYQYLDTGIRPGALYQYYVVGITNDGLAQRSFVVTSRVPR